MVEVETGTKQKNQDLPECMNSLQSLPGSFQCENNERFNRDKFSVHHLHSKSSEVHSNWYAI